MLYYIDLITDIKEPITVQPYIDLLRQASATDTIELYINSDGGIIDTINYLASAIRASKAAIYVLYYGNHYAFMPILKEADYIVLMEGYSMYRDYITLYSQQELDSLLTSLGTIISFTDYLHMKDSL